MVIVIQIMFLLWYDALTKFFYQLLYNNNNNNNNIYSYTAYNTQKDYVLYINFLQLHQREMVLENRDFMKLHVLASVSENNLTSP